MYARAVWIENGREMEGVVPNNWINMNTKMIRWPNTRVKEAFKMKKDPKDDWLMFPLIKRKMNSDNIRDCENYNMTSQAEEEEEEVLANKRKRPKRSFDDYVVDSELEEEEERVMGNKLPPFPAPPKKLRPVVNKAAENSTSLPGPVEFTDSQHTKQKTAKYSDGSRHSDKSGQRDRSRHSVTSTHSKGSRHSNRSSDVSMDSVRSRHSIGSRKHTVRPRDSASSRNSIGSSNESVISSNSTVSRNSSIRYRDDGVRSSHTIGSKDHSSRYRDDTVRSRHNIGSKDHSSRYRDDTVSSRHSNGSKDNSNRYRDDSVRPRHSISQRHNVFSNTGSRDAGAQKATDMFPMPTAKFQKKVLSKLIEIHMEVRRLGKSEPAFSASHIKMLESMEDFQREEQRLSDSQAFDALVLQLSRIGGKDVKDCVYKVLDRLFSNHLMTYFNMKGKGNKDKMALETTQIYRAIKVGVMKWSKDATEQMIKKHASEHLKRAPSRKGGGAHN